MNLLKRIFGKYSKTCPNESKSERGSDSREQPSLDEQLASAIGRQDWVEVRRLLKTGAEVSIAAFEALEMALRQAVQARDELKPPAKDDPNYRYVMSFFTGGEREMITMGDAAEELLEFFKKNQREAEIADAIKANRFEAERLEAEAVAKGELLPRPCEANRDISHSIKNLGIAEQAPNVAAQKQTEGTFSAAGLTWQREPARWKMNWEDAKSYAARLTLAGGGWRLPKVSELEALYEAKLSSSITAAHPGMGEGWYWSESPPVEPVSVLVCAGCGQRYEIGEDAVAVSMEFGLRLAKGAVVLTRGGAVEREDLVAKLKDDPPGSIRAALARAHPSWESIRASLGRGERRIWRCKDCNTINSYQPSGGAKKSENSFYILGVDFMSRASGPHGAREFERLGWSSHGGEVSGRSLICIEMVRCVRNPTEQDKIKLAAAAREEEAQAALKEAKVHFFNAIRNGDLGIVERLLNDIPDLLLSKDGQDNWPLHLAAEGGHKAIVALVLDKKKCDVNVKARNGIKPLHLAAERGNKDVVEMLLNKKADVNAKTNKGYTPLHLAAEKGHKGIVELLLLKSANMNAITNKGFTPLQLAVLADKQDVVELLREHGGS